MADNKVDLKNEGVHWDLGHFPVLWRIPAARQAAGRAETQLHRAGRDVVHHRPPGVGTVDAAVPARARPRVRVRAPRQPRSLVQDAGAHLAAAGRVARRLERAVDAHAVRILVVQKHPRSLLRIPVAAVPAARVQARQQESRRDRRSQARPGRLREAGARAERAFHLRRSAAPAVPPRLRHSRRAHRA